MRRVVISGIGIRSPLGLSAASFMASALAGRNAIAPIAKFDASEFSVQMGGEIQDRESQIDFPAERHGLVPRMARWAILAAREAVVDAGLELTEDTRRNTDVVMGVGAPSLDAVEEQAIRISKEGPGAASLTTPILMNPSNPAVQIGIDLDLRSEVVTICTACASSSNAIGYGLRLIRHGESECVLAGGVDEGINPTFLASFGKGVLSTRNFEPSRASRPFDRDRDGYVLSDAAVVFVLEEYERAKRRGANIYAELSGFGASSEATSPMKVGKSEEPAAICIEKALRMAQRLPDEIGYYCAHGSSSRWTDVRETRTIKRVFREHARKLHISSIKSMMGHPLGAAGAVQVATAALAIRKQAVPPTINYQEPDPDCDLDYVPNEARSVKIRNAVVYSLGNGGVNTALVVSAC